MSPPNAARHEHEGLHEVEDVKSEGEGGGEGGGEGAAKGEGEGKQDSVQLGGVAQARDVQDDGIDKTLDDKTLDGKAADDQHASTDQRTSAELVEQLTAKTQELALETHTQTHPSPPPPPPPTTTQTHTHTTQGETTQTTQPPSERGPAPSERAAGKAPASLPCSPSPPPPPPKDDKYLDSTADYAARIDRHDAVADLADGTPGDAPDDTAEIQSIMHQFADADANANTSTLTSPSTPVLLDSPAFPPRRSSLVPVDKPLPTPTPTDDPTDTPSTPSVTSPSAHAAHYKPSQPAPPPEPDLPFDFHRFLEQLRHRTADPVAKFLRSFLLEFGKKQWMVHEQVKIIADFLEFISKKMSQCDVWRTVSDAEFDNAREGMEKLVMNRLYSQTFSPAIPPPQPVSPRKGRRRQEAPGPGRRGQHQEDVERDQVLAQKVRIYKWVREEHLDIKDVGDKGRKFLALAQQELLKIKTYRAPRDKIICILNCCKVIFGFLRTSKSDQSADAFVPLLIYTVLQANPEHLVSNVQYILRFRNQDKLGGEAGYYISSLMGAVQFIEGLDKTSLTVTDEEFDRNVEAAVSAIAEKHAPNSPEADTDASAEIHPESAAGPAHLHPSTPNHRRMPSPHYLSEKSQPSRPEVITRNSMEAQTAGPRRSASLRAHESSPESSPEEENAAVAGLLRTIQRPLSTIGRMFSDSDTPASAPPRSASTPNAHHAQQPGYERFPGAASRPSRSDAADADDAAARQASVEQEQARRIHAQEQSVVVETLRGMFPQLDGDVIEDVVREKEGRVGLAVDACLALANP